MHEIRLNNKVFNGPAGWQDLDSEGLLQVAAITNLTRFKKFIPQYLLIKLFKVPAPMFSKLRDCQKIQLEVCLEWLSTKNTLHKWLLKSYSIRGIKYRGPADRLANITVEEFIYAEAAYDRWQRDRSVKHLYDLFAALYRRHSFISSQRLELTDRRRAVAVLFAEKLPMAALYALAINYAGCRNFIIDAHPNIWIKPDEPIIKAGDIPNNKPVNWVSFTLDLSGDKFGTYEQTVKTKLWIFLKEMDKRVESMPKGGNS